LNNPGWEEKRPEVIGQRVVSLISKLDEHMEDPAVRMELKHALLHLADIKLALNESSIVAVTDHRGIIQYVNDKFCEISKYEREELMGKDHRIINSGYHSKNFMNELWKSIASGSVWRGDIKNRAKDGSYYWVNTTIVPFLNAKGKPYQYLAIRNEVTELKRVQEELQQMMKQVMIIQEEERRRLSRELHDGIGQSLFSLLIGMDKLIQDGSLDDAERLRTSVSHLMEDVRSLAWELRPSVLDDLGVVPAIRTYTDNFTNHYGIGVKLDIHLRRRLGPQEETTIYRIIQEALTNIGKYADVDECFITLSDLPDRIEVNVVDEGKGFQRDSSTIGVGLFSMEERARAIDGQLVVQSQPGQGTKIQLIIPKKS
jgi:two-component system sensor histidine kinase NreB